MPRRAKPLEYYYIKTETCWNWIGGRTGDYGSVRFHGIVTRAHIAVYKTLKGDYPVGLVLDHLCRNTLCVNPDHLEPVTKGTNSLRGIGKPAMNARKTHCISGHPLDEINTYIYPDGRRSCRICRDAAVKQFRRFE